MKIMQLFILYREITHSIKIFCFFKFIFCTKTVMWFIVELYVSDFLLLLDVSEFDIGAASLVYYWKVYCSNINRSFFASASTFSHFNPNMNVNIGKHAVDLQPIMQKIFFKSKIYLHWNIIKSGMWASQCGIPFSSRSVWCEVSFLSYIGFSPGQLIETTRRMLNCFRL